MFIDVKPFIVLMRRVLKCKYDKVILKNRLIMQCYDIDIDSDIGMHYVLPIPNNELYKSDFYNQYIIFSPKDILNIYNDGHKVLLERKKDDKLKPKDVKEEIYFNIEKNKGVFKFIYYTLDKLLCQKVYYIDYPVNETLPIISNCIDTYNTIKTRIKPGGLGIIINGKENNLIQIAQESSDIYYFKISLNNEKIKVPIIKSMFLGNKNWDEFYMSIQETTIKNIYLFCYQLTNNEISEEYFGYIQNF